MVGKVPGILAAMCMLCLLSSCDILTTTPFPGFIDKTDISIDLASHVDSIGGGKAGTSFDLAVVPGATPRVLLLVEPPSSDSSGTFNYTGQLIFMDKDLNVVGQAATASPTDYFSKPYTYTHDGTNILAGYTVLTQDGGKTSASQSSPTGIVGYAFATATETYTFATTPSGAYASFDLTWRGYNNGSAWSIDGNSGTIAIIPQASRPSDSNLGYQLAGLSFNSASSEITFVFSQPSVGRVVAVRTTLAGVTSGGNPVIFPSGEAWPVSIDADRPAVFADTEGLFLVRRDGWLDRQSWTQTGALSLTGTTRIVGDKSLSRRYAFLAQQASSGPSYMYRFDPSSRILTRYRRWW